MGSIIIEGLVSKDPLSEIVWGYLISGGRWKKISIDWRGFNKWKWTVKFCKVG